ncbi:MAG: polymer-forming cytoskeletal protein [Halobacteriales archaeon]|nr:polymer-forming cytoskeletal protein [Halobacteriales archaeon]
MQKNRNDPPKELGDVVSIVGPGMKIVGDCSSDGTIRVEGRVEGSVKAGKSVVVGKDGKVKGDISTQDAIIAGEVNGSVTAESRVELQSTCRVQGDIRSRRVKLDEGGQVDGQLHMGASATRDSGSGSAAAKSEAGRSAPSDDSNGSKDADKSSDRGADKARTGRQ